MNIAIFGGSFDPPHLGHLSIVDEVLKSLAIDRLIVVPTYLNPFKNEFHATPEIRAKWIKKLFNDNDKIEISTFELESKKPTPSIITVKEFIKIYNPDRIYLIIGADNVKSLHKWNSYDELKELVTFVIANRDGIDIDNKFISLDVDCKISSTQLRESLVKKDNSYHQFLPEKIKNDILKEYSNE